MSDLYKIMLVDDEEEVRLSIIKKIDWEKVGFIVVGDAENGEEAIEKAEYLEPDVVLTDIRMPFMDGLTLGKRLLELFPSIKILLFSGFDDFEYAKQAISIHVVEYILKPVNVEELTEILLRVKQNLDKEIEERRDIQRLRENYLRELPVLKEQFLGNLIRGRLEETEIEQKLHNYDISLTPADEWYCCVVRIENHVNKRTEPLSFHKETELIPISVKDLIEEKINNIFPFSIFNYSGDLVILAGVNGEAGIRLLLEQMNDICKESRRILHVSITIGIGTGCNSLTELSNSYKEACSSVDYKAVVGSGNTIYFGDMEYKAKLNAPLRLDSRTEGRLLSAVKFGESEKIERIVEEIIEKLGRDSLHLRHYQVYLIGVLNALVHLIQQYELDMDEIMGNEPDYFEILSSFKSVKELRKWLMEICLRMHENIYKEREHAAKNIIREAKRYIIDNYWNPELSVDMICQEMHISPAYFSTLFKKEIGQSYVSYLTDIRLTRAAELLSRTEEKTYLIAQKVGYQETNYFSYVFKKKYGVSPTKYRGN